MSLFGSLSSNFGVSPWGPFAPGLCDSKPWIWPLPTCLGSPTIPACPVVPHRVVLTVDFSVVEQKQALPVSFLPFSAWKNLGLGRVLTRLNLEPDLGSALCSHCFY